jgi:hypothetical protein
MPRAIPQQRQWDSSTTTTADGRPLLPGVRRQPESAVPPLAQPLLVASAPSVQQMAHTTVAAAATLSAGDSALYSERDGSVVRVTVTAVSTNVPAGEEPEISVRMEGGNVRQTVLARLTPATASYAPVVQAQGGLDLSVPVQVVQAVQVQPSASETVFRVDSSRSDGTTGIHTRPPCKIRHVHTVWI